MEIKQVNDYVDKVHEKFDKLDKEEIKRILNYGFKIYHYLNYYGCDVMIKDTMSLKFLMYTGKIFKKYESYYKYYIRKFKNKLRILDRRKKTEWDGYYYIGLSDSYYNDYLSQKEDELIIFDDIKLFRLLDEAKTYNSFKHYFKFKSREYYGYGKYMEHFEINNCDLIEL